MLLADLACFRRCCVQIGAFRPVEEHKLLEAPVVIAESVVEQINPLEDHASVTDRGAAMMTNANAGQYDEVKVGMTGAATSTSL